MEDLDICTKEIYEIENKKYTVITKTTKDFFDKDKFIKLICSYAMKELNEDI